MKKREIISLITLISFLFISQVNFAQEPGKRENSSGNAAAGKVFQCPSDPGVISNNPGRCSKCDYKFVCGGWITTSTIYKSSMLFSPS